MNWISFPKSQSLSPEEKTYKDDVNFSTEFTQLWKRRELYYPSKYKLLSSVWIPKKVQIIPLPKFDFWKDLGSYITEKNVREPHATVEDNENVKAWLVKGSSFCVTMNFIPPEELEIKQEIYQKIVNDKETQLFDLLFLSRDQPLFEVLLDNIPLLYETICYRMVVNALQSLIQKQTNIHCDDIFKIIQQFKHAYTGPRMSYHIVMEYKLNLLLRNDQMEFMEKILHFDSSYIHLEEAIMGSGKTSVIVPLMAQTLLETASTVFIVVPKHMKAETLQQIHRGTDLPFVDEMLNSSRQNPFANIPFLFYAQEEKKSGIQPFSILLLDDIEFKRLKLNLLCWHKTLTLDTVSQIEHIFQTIPVIVDEFDSVYDPTTSVLQYPVGEKNLDATGIGFGIWSKVIDWIFLDKPSDMIPEIIYIKQKDTLQLVYRVEYGPSHESPEKLETVPYKYSEEPIEGSSFSDIFLQILLTFTMHKHLPITSYLYSFHIYHYLLLYVLPLYNQKEEMLRLQILGLDFSWIPPTLLNMLRTLDEKRGIQSLQERIQSLSLTKESLLLFKTAFLKKIVLPSLGDSWYIASVSFLEAMFGYKKIYALSGTTNVILPDTTNRSVENKKRKPVNPNTGAILYALGEEDKTIAWNSKEDAAKQLQRIEPWDAFIDAGAFLSGIDIESLAKLYSTLSKKRVIFINAQQRKLIVSGSDVTNYVDKIVPKDAVLLYDQSHCIGVNIVQRIPMIGLVTVSKKTKFSFLAQAAYRLRNINYGHHIRLVTKNQVENTVDTLRLVQTNEDHFVHVLQEKYRLEQCIYLHGGATYLRPKYSSLLDTKHKSISNFHKQYVAYLQDQPFARNESSFFTELEKLHIVDDEPSFQTETLFEQVKEQVKTMTHDDMSKMLNIGCGVALLGSIEKGTKPSMLIDSKWNIEFDLQFDLLQFAARPLATSNFDTLADIGFFGSHATNRIINLMENKKMQTPPPWYYESGDKGIYRIHSQPKQYRFSTDRKPIGTMNVSMHILLKWMSGSPLTILEQIGLYHLFLSNRNLYSKEHVHDVIACLNGARGSPFVNWSILSKVLDIPSWKDFCKKLSQDGASLLFYGFEDEFLSNYIWKAIQSSETTCPVEEPEISAAQLQFIEEAKIRKQQAEQEMLEKAEKEQAEKERVTKEQAEKVEKDRVAREQAEKLAREEKVAREKEKMAIEQAEKVAKEERVARDKAEKEKAAREQAERVAREQAEKEKVAREKSEKEKVAKVARDAREQAEKEKIAREQAEKQKLAREKSEKEKVAKEQAEKEKLAKEQAEKEKAAKVARDEKLAKEQAEKEKLAKVARDEKLAKEQAEKVAKEQAEKVAKEQAEKVAKEQAERVAREQAAKLAREKAQAEKEKAAQIEKDRLAHEKIEREIERKRQIERIVQEMQNMESKNEAKQMVQQMQQEEEVKAMLQQMQRDEIQQEATALTRQIQKEETFGIAISPTIYTGPNGGKYYFNDRGKKVYVKR